MTTCQLRSVGESDVSLCEDIMTCLCLYHCSHSVLASVNHGKMCGAFFPTPIVQSIGGRVKFYLHKRLKPFGEDVQYQLSLFKKKERKLIIVKVCHLRN